MINNRFQTQITTILSSDQYPAPAFDIIGASSVHSLALFEDNTPFPSERSQDSIIFEIIIINKNALLMIIHDCNTLGNWFPRPLINKNLSISVSLQEGVQIRSRRGGGCARRSGGNNLSREPDKQCNM